MRPARATAEQPLPDKVCRLQVSKKASDLAWSDRQLMQDAQQGKQTSLLTLLSNSSDFLPYAVVASAAAAL